MSTFICGLADFIGKAALFTVGSHVPGDDEALKTASRRFASAPGKHLTGQNLAVDGGVSAVYGS